MRALVVHPGFDISVSDVHVGWCEALTELGVEVVEYNLNDRLEVYGNVHLKKGRRWVPAFPEDAAKQLAAQAIESAAFRWWPDFVLVVSAFFVPTFTMDLLRARGMKVVLLCTESPYEDDRQLTLAAHADLTLLNDPTGLDKFKMVGEAYYQPHSYRPTVHFPQPKQEQYVSDFCFVGSGFPSRIEFFEKVDWTGIDALFAGTWKALEEDSPLRPFVAHDLELCLDNRDAVAAYCSTKVSANLYRREANRPELAHGWAIGPREVELAACGVPFLRERRGEGDELFPFLPTFETPDEFNHELRWLLAHDELRKEIARKSRAAVSERTFHAAAKRLLTHVG